MRPHLQEPPEEHLPFSDAADTELAAKERRLEELEGFIESRYVDIGFLLEEIAEKKLYKVRGLTWAQYVQQRWKISREHADRLRRAARLAREIGPTGPVPPTERAARAQLDRRREEEEGARDLVAKLNNRARNPKPGANVKQPHFGLTSAVTRFVLAASRVTVDGVEGVWFPATEWRVFFAQLPRSIRDLAIKELPRDPVEAGPDEKAAS
jgi:hypothetical protein